jgi:hypothetical protein
MKPSPTLSATGGWLGSSLGASSDADAAGALGATLDAPGPLHAASSTMSVRRTMGRSDDTDTSTDWAG